LTFYAEWSGADLYHITYILNGGDNHVMNPDYYTVDDFVQLRDPYRNGYTFGGWAE
jgi:hypothetical protein